MSLRGRVALGLAWLGLCGTVAAAEWTGFRGSAGTGVAPPATIPTTWSATENLRWKVAVPGAGWSQPVVWGDRVYVTTALAAEAIRPKDFRTGVSDPRSMPGSKAAPPDTMIQWQVLALGLSDGASQWTATASEGKPQFAIHPSNTYATETPLVDAQGVYAFFGATGTLTALDHQGQKRWQQELGAHPVTENFGTGASPVLVDGVVIVQAFNQDQAFLVGFDAQSGAEKWRIVREEAASSWSTPFVWRHSGRTEVLAAGGKLLTSHDPQTGAELWRVGGLEMPSTGSITGDAERVYFGHRSPFASGPLYALVAGASGDQSPAAGSKEIKCQAWSRASAAPGMPSPLVAGGHVYTLNSSVIACHDAATGEPRYKERLAKLGSIAASPVAVDDKLVVVGETGHAVVLALGPEFRVLGTPQLDDVFWSSPAVAEGQLLLRGIDALYCVGH